MIRAQSLGKRMAAISSLDLVVLITMFYWKSMKAKIPVRIEFTTSLAQCLGQSNEQIMTKLKPQRRAC